uniref:DVU0298 family protein n=1 Tax=Candidatus Electronema sp. TaxID=2698783 RepID=UPI00405740A4
MSARKIKQQVLDLLNQEDLAEIERGLTALDAKEAVNALLAAICRSEERLRWHAVTAMGWTVARLADEEMEEARIIMRRLLWSLNEESGGIGWGAPEAMAEIFCRHEGLAEEYVHMLLSYMRPDGDLPHQDGNFLEHETLQRGLLWAAGRLAQCRRELALTKGMADDLPQYLDSPDGAVRGLAARAMGLLGRCHCLERLYELQADSSPLRLYEEGKISTVTVAELAAQAVERLGV